MTSPSVDVFKRLGASLRSAFAGPAFEKFKTKITSREVVAPLVYALITMTIFATVYSIVGYENIFETTETNKHKNIENSVTASIMLQSNAMGSVVPINSLGQWLMNAQVLFGWLYFLAIIYLIV